MTPGHTAKLHSCQLQRFCTLIEKENTKPRLFYHTTRQHVDYRHPKAVIDFECKNSLRSAICSDLTALDYHLFPSIQHSLSIQKCWNVFGVGKSNEKFIASKPESFYQDWIKKKTSGTLTQKFIEGDRKYLDD